VTNCQALSISSDSDVFLLPPSANYAFEYR
jgi:hypothetical protein